MKKLLTFIVTALFVVGFCLSDSGITSFDSYAASDTLTFMYLDSSYVADTDGNNITITTTSIASDDTFDTVTAIDSTITKFVYDGCRVASKPSDVFNNTVTDASVVTVIRSSDITASGTFGDNGAAEWFIVGTTLYITGSDTVTVADTSTYGSGTATLSFTGVTFLAGWPSLVYGDQSLNYGVPSSSVGDEKVIADDSYYDTSSYVSPTTVSDYMTVTAADRDSISYNAYVVAPVAATSDFGWTSYFNSITEIYVGDDISFAGNLAFYFNLSSTLNTPSTIGQSVYTSLEKIHFYASTYTDATSCVTSTTGMFARIPNLTTIDMRASQTMNLTGCFDTSYMFYGDENLVNGSNSLVDNINLSNAVATGTTLKTSGLLDTAYMFADCKSIVQPNVRDYNMSGVKSINGMFYGASSAGLISTSSGTEGYNIYSWDLSSVQSALFAFDGNILSGDLTDPTSNTDPGFDTIDEANVIIGEVDMSEWDMTSLVTAYMMFAQNSGMTGLVFDTDAGAYASLVDASGMCNRCDNLNIVSAAGVDFSALKNGTIMFRGAGRSNSGGVANFSGASFSALTNAALMFEGAGFGTINFDGSEDMDTLVEAVAMFADNPYLTSLGTQALSNWTLTSLENASYMFNNDSSLVILNTSGWSLPKAKTIAFMFSDCQVLSNGVDTSAWTVGSASTFTDMQNFAYNTAVSTFDISGFDLSDVTDMQLAFAENESLTTLTLPSSGYSSVTNMFGFAADCPALTSVSEIPECGALVDARGAFAFDTALTSIDITDMISSSADIAYLLRGASSLVSIDISGWDSSSVEYAQGLFDGCSSLVNIVTASTNSFDAVKSLGMSFRDCYALTSTSLNGFLANLTSTTALLDLYESFNNAYAITSLDLSGMDLSAVTDYERMACMDENASYTTNKLVTIKVPATIFTASGASITNSGGTSINAFWVDGDGEYDGNAEESTSTDDLATTLFVNGTTIPSKLAAYNFGGTNGDNDNRSFVTVTARSINGTDTGNYSISSSTDEAVMLVEALSTFYTGGTDTTTATALDPSYSWTRGGSSISNSTNTYTATSSTTGTYVATTKAPSSLTGSNSTVDTTFIIGAPISSISATYTGDPVTVGTTYSKDDVVVTATDANGDTITLTSSDFTVDTQKVSKSGTNTFTVYYPTSNGTLETAFTVTGVRRIGSIVSTYTGPSVLVGKTFDTDYVTTTAYYVDDTSKTQGFEVTESAYSATTISSVGDNKITVTYNDPDQDGKAFYSTITVNGYKPIKSISATYKGNDIEVGSSYSKDDVVVTLTYADGSGSATTTNFTVDTTTVTSVGANSYIATYRDPYGNTYTAGFSVTGYSATSTTASASSSKTASSVVAPTTTVGTGSNSSGVTTSTSTGVVQTGATGKAALYVIAFAFLVVVIFVALVFRRKVKKDEDF